MRNPRLAILIGEVKFSKNILQKSRGFLLKNIYSFFGGENRFLAVTRIASTLQVGRDIFKNRNIFMEVGTMRNLDKMLGTLYGQAVGSAMAMPTTGWARERILKEFPLPISDFLDGPLTNIRAKDYHRGQYTVGLQQALVVIQALHAAHWEYDQSQVAQHLLDWARRIKAYEKVTLDETSKTALRLFAGDKDITRVTQIAVDNGSVGRMPLIGALYTPAEKMALVEMVYQVSKITHETDVTIAGGALIAGAVAAAVADYDWEQIIEFALVTSELGESLGAPTYSARVKQRVRLGLHIAKQFKEHPAGFERAIYELVGTSELVSESVAAALAIAYYTQDVKKCAALCANLGGDIDMIGALATSICGAKNGWQSIPKDWCSLIDRQNPPQDLKGIGQQMLTFQPMRASQQL